MRRRLFNLAAAVSLVLCVATCVLWVSSYAGFHSLWYWSRPDAALNQTGFFIVSVTGVIQYDYRTLQVSADKYTAKAGFGTTREANSWFRDYGQQIRRDAERYG